MKVTGAVFPFLPLCRRLLPSSLAGLSLALLKATALELAILAGHVLLYPSGITQERRTTPQLPAQDTAQLPTETTPPSSCCTASSTTAPSSSCCAAASPSTAGTRSSRSTTPR